MSSKFYLVTGGTGFIGSALVRRLVKDGYRVRVLDNDSRGSASRLDDIADSFEFVAGDIRNAATVAKAAEGVDAVAHLAFVNGTEFFYSKPELVLDVGVRGMLNVLDACRDNNIPELILASSSEVYQTPPEVPTNESVPLSVPDPLNPRYSYGGGKIISELLAVNYGRKYFEKVIVFRPHNVFGPCMGWEHVIPQFVLRMRELAGKIPGDTIDFPIQGTGEETRSFVFIDDFTDGLIIAMERGEHLGIYHIGTMEEMSIADVARAVGEYFGKSVNIVTGPLQKGGTPRRCPDTGKLAALGYSPRVSFKDALAITAKWYDEDADESPKKGE